VVGVLKGALPSVVGERERGASSGKLVLLTDQQQLWSCWSSDEILSSQGVQSVSKAHRNSGTIRQLGAMACGHESGLTHFSSRFQNTE
jgi:hypothetical protein